MSIDEEIYALAQQYLRGIKRSGPENILAICPFHSKADGSPETTPSFALSVTRGLFFCHSCHSKGGLRRLLIELGIPASEVAFRYQYLIDQTLRAYEPRQRDILRVDRVWADHELPKSLLGLFDHPVQHLLPDFTEETLEHFNVGWDGWHQRVTFPIYNAAELLVGISGRAVHDNQGARYRVYLDEYRLWDLVPTKSWDKSTVLWHYHDVLPRAVHEPGRPRVLVVEGFKAAMWAWQAGIHNVVATMGSYLSWEQEWLLNNIGAEVLMMYDRNRAGWRGQLQAAERIAQALPVRLVQYPERLLDDEGAQPDSLHADELVEQVGSAVTLERWLIDRLGTEEQRRYIGKLMRDRAYQVKREQDGLW